MTPWVGGVLGFVVSCAAMSYAVVAMTYARRARAVMGTVVQRGNELEQQRDDAVAAVEFLERSLAHRLVVGVVPPGTVPGPLSQGRVVIDMTLAGLALVCRMGAFEGEGRALFESGWWRNERLPAGSVLAGWVLPPTAPGARPVADMLTAHHAAAARGGPPAD